MRNSILYLRIAVAIIILGLLCIIWLNFHSSLFYTADLYSDAYVAKLISSEHSLFPSNWVFGNQYYTIATPVVSALIISLFGVNSITAMGIASTVMCFILLLSTIYLFRSVKVSYRNCIICIAVFVSFAVLDYYNHMTLLGPQLVFTKASYYSCYLIVSFLTVGYYSRIWNRHFQIGDIFQISFISALHFLCGMQSLRELLIVNIPLFILFILQSLVSKSRINTRCLFLLILLIVMECLGYFYTKSLSIPAVSIFVANNDYWVQIKETVRAIIAVTGLFFFKYLLKGEIVYVIPIAVSCVTLIINYIAIRHIIREKSIEGINGIIVFFLLSLSCVAGCCIVPIVKPNPHYFFMYYALSVACAASLLTKRIHMQKNPQTSRVYFLAFVFSALLGLSWNFVPYIRADYRDSKPLSSFTQQLIDDGVHTVLVHYQDAPVFAAASRDSITTGIYGFDDSANNMISPIPYLQDSSVFSGISSRKALLCLTDNSINLMPPIVKDAIFPTLTYYSEVEINHIKYYLFLIDPSF